MSNRQKYSPEFRTEAVKLVLEHWLNRDDAAKRLAMPCYAPDYFGGNSINYPTLLNGYFSNKTLN